jgi:hypothetical protein
MSVNNLGKSFLKMNWAAFQMCAFSEMNGKNNGQQRKPKVLNSSEEKSLQNKQINHKAKMKVQYPH